MEIISKYALSISTEQIKLLYILGGILNILLFSYLGILLSGLFISISHRNKWLKENNYDELENAQFVMKILKINKINLFLFSPSLIFTSILLSIQIFQVRESFIIPSLILSLLFLFTGLVLFNSYNNSLKFLSLLNNQLKDNSEGKDKLLLKNILDNKRGGYLSLLSILVSLFFYTGSISLGMDTYLNSSVNNVLSFLFTPILWIRFILLGLVSFITGLLYLAVIINQKSKDKEINISDRQLNYIKIVFRLVLLLPLFIIFDLLITRDIAYSGLFFSVSFLLLIIILIVSVLIYSIIKGFNENHLLYSFIFILVFLSLFILREQYTTHIVNKKDALIIAAKHLEYEEVLKSKLGISTVTISGEDIYNGKCSACHKFDEKLVGPPYKLVLPKYTNKKGDLVSFILNPRKIDPAYPPMPAQGLKPNEAEAVADFLLSKYQSK